MATTDEMMNDARCLEQCIPGTDLKLAVLIYLYAQIAGVSTDTNSLIDGAKCIAACIPGVDMKLAVLISLAAQGGTGGGGSSGGVTCGAGAPTSVPSSGCAFYIQTDSTPPGIIWQYYSGAWH